MNAHPRKTDKGLSVQREPKRLELRIEENYDSLPPAERRLGDLLKDFPGDIATYSATELATLAGTSKAAATRFFRRLGYSDFNEARRQIREARRWGSPLYTTHTSQEAEKPTLAVSTHMERESVNLCRTLEGLRPDTLREVSTAISRARRVFVVGFRNSRIFADYLQSQLSVLRPDVHIFPAAGQTLGECIVDMGPEDILIIIGLRRRVSLISQLMKVALRLKTPILLITDPSASKISKVATWPITCQIRSTSVFDSYTPVISVLTLIVNLVMQENLEQSYERLKGIEEAHEVLDELQPKNKFETTDID